MDEDYDEDYYYSRPRYKLVAGSSEDILETKEINKSLVYTCTAIGCTLAAAAILTTGVLQFLLLWIGASLCIGPRAPQFLTGGDIRVGVGEILPEFQPKLESSSVKPLRNKKQGREQALNPDSVANGSSTSLIGGQLSTELKETARKAGWSEEDLDLLHKMAVKYPKGTARRWEVILQNMQQKHSLDQVVKMGKELENSLIKGNGIPDIAAADTKAAETKLDGSIVGNSFGFSEDEDRNLVKALKDLPKDTPSRWDKVAAAVGRSKQQCFKRFSELKDVFRSSKSVSEKEQAKGDLAELNE